MSISYPDKDLVNADWTKRTWGLKDVNSVASLEEFLDSIYVTVEQFKRLPVYRWNLGKLPWLKEL